jgi:hypothetical protein
MALHNEQGTRHPADDCVIRYATTDDVPALRRLVERANARLFCGPALVAETAGVLGAAVSLRDGQVIADPSQPPSVLRQLLRTRRDTSLAHS